MHSKPLSFSETPAAYLIVFKSELFNQPLVFCKPFSLKLKYGMDSKKALQAVQTTGGEREERMSSVAA